MQQKQIRCIAGVFAVFCLGAAMTLSGGCIRKSGAREVRKQGPVPVTTQPVMIQPVQRVRDVVGTLYGDEELTIAAKVPGRIVEIYKEMGERIDSGEKLCLISPIDYELACKQKELMAKEPLAKVGLSELPPANFDVTTVATVVRAAKLADNAKAKYDRAKKLREESSSSISDQDFADFKTTWEVAQSAYDVEILTAKALLAQASSAYADLAVARQRLADTVICAPPPMADTPGQAPRIRHYGVSARIASVGEFMKEGLQRLPARR